MIAERLFRRDTSTLAAPADWLKDALGVIPGPTGKTVTDRTALKVSAVFACVRVIAETVSTLPAHEYERVDQRTKQRVYGGPLGYRLGLRPNPEQTAERFWENIVGFLCLWGRAPAYIDRDPLGQVRALWPLPPSAVTEIRLARDDYRLSGYRLDANPYVGSIFGGQVIEPMPLLPEEVLDFRAFSYDSFDTPIRRHAETIGLASAAEEWAGRTFANDGTPGGVIELPEGSNRDTAEYLREKWQERHRGISRSHLIGILAGGAKWRDVGMNPQDTQLLESRRFSVEEIARAFRMPLHKIGHLERATFSNIEHQSIEFATDTIRPWLVRLEQEVRFKIYGAGSYPDPGVAGTFEEPGSKWLEFDLDGLLRGDMQARFTAYAIGRMWGILSSNDARSKENEPPVEGGDSYLQPGNMVPMGTVPTPPPPSGNGGAPDAAAALDHVPPSAIPSSLRPNGSDGTG